MESKALRELSALYLDTVYDEGYKPYPKEKVDSQKDKAYKKEMIARGGKKTDEKDKEADKQYERRIAMDFKTKMRKEEVQSEERKEVKAPIQEPKEKLKKPSRSDRVAYHPPGPNSARRSHKLEQVEVQREDFINKLIESGKFTEEEIQSIVDEAFKALTPDKKQAIKNQAERRKKSADRAQNASDYETSTKQDQQVRNMKAVV